MTPTEQDNTTSSGIPNNSMQDNIEDVNQTTSSPTIGDGDVKQDNTMRDVEVKISELMFLKLGIDMARKDMQYPLVLATDIDEFKQYLLALIANEKKELLDRLEGKRINVTVTSGAVKSVQLDVVTLLDIQAERAALKESE